MPPTQKSDRGSKNHWLVVWNIFYFPIYWEESSQLTNIFQRGSNHQPDHCSIRSIPLIPIIIAFLLLASRISRIINSTRAGGILSWLMRCFFDSSSLSKQMRISPVLVWGNISMSRLPWIQNNLAAGVPHLSCLVGLIHWEILTVPELLVNQQLWNQMHLLCKPSLSAWGGPCLGYSNLCKQAGNFPCDRSFVNDISTIASLIYRLHIHRRSPGSPLWLGLWHCASHIEMQTAYPHCTPILSPACSNYVNKEGNNFPSPWQLRDQRKFQALEKNTMIFHFGMVTSQSLSITIPL